MATISSEFIPYYIKSDAIAVFPCANRSNSYASRFTTEYNLTHLGLPNASWISKVGNKKTGDSIEPTTDKISCVINGYFFEFSLNGACDINGTTVLLDTNLTLTAYIATKAPAENGDDPLKKQPQLCALVTLNDDLLSAALDLNTVFLGLAIFVGAVTDPISDATAYSLQLASSGSYSYIGIMPLMPLNAITTNRLSDGAVTTAKLDDEAVTEAKLGNVVNSSVSTLGSANNNKLGVCLRGGNGHSIKALLSGSVATGDIEDNAITPLKLGYILSQGSASASATSITATSNGITATLSQNNDGLSIGLSSSKVNLAETANKIKIGANAYTLSLSDNVLTLTVAK